ncbi:hypothetical protein ACS0TY_017958 [Phlomoides rotata]
MCFDHVKPDGFTLVSLFTACSELGALTLGRRAHVYMMKVGLDKNVHAANALIVFYAKCGNIMEARKVFNELEQRSIVSWTSLIVGLAVNGFGDKALTVFKKMEMLRLVPTEITFVRVLYACSHCGMVDEGFSFYDKMMKVYRIVPKIEHYGSMVDLLGRAGGGVTVIVRGGVAVVVRGGVVGVYLPMLEVKLRGMTKECFKDK